MENEFKELGLNTLYDQYEKEDMNNNTESLYKRYDLCEKESPNGTTLFRQNDRNRLLNVFL